MKQIIDSLFQFDLDKS